ncbi:MAG: GNAT family N-acetyltransferase [Pseudomonadota bacterium]
MTLRFEISTGADIRRLIPDLAALRVSVFRAWPYLYDGDAAYEADYLSKYAEGEAIVVAAYAGNQVVGAATGMPLVQADAAISTAVAAHMANPHAVFYCAESVLLPAHRGQGAGDAFFSRREAHARRIGCQDSVFAAVQRPGDHPARPVDYRPLDRFWDRHGYRPIPGVTVGLSWRDVGSDAETEKRLQIWHKAL